MCVHPLVAVGHAVAVIDTASIARRYRLTPAGHRCGYAASLWSPAMKLRHLVALLALFSVPAVGEPIDPDDVRVIDGDTIRVYHKQPNVRLVGFNAPETRRAACAAERELAQLEQNRPSDIDKSTA